ncbi:SLATT domain-containing protein [Streptomyces sp. SID13031]|uniref:SLATT domain-containing protein n=1 Tax=Streptomyces sp. SID13031 TaxID=2706046 RepID=UPI0013C9B7E6|nr:SLATT domain-containing protein [Streptomyces sp. SID13031]NEA32642.1 SLATT domain-containing protein [Streptomyces sp. SID13031]
MTKLTLPRRRKRRDLRPVASPIVQPADWAEPEPALHRLYVLAEGEALDAIDWYLEDKRTKRRASRLLRALAIVLASAGGIYPLAVRADADVAWGYLLLGAAGVCLAFDRFFGLSSAWMRDMATVNRLRGTLLRFQHEWAAAALVAAAGADEASVRMRLGLLQAFAVEVPAQIQQETESWQGEFASLVGQLDVTGSHSPRPGTEAS